MSQTVPARRGRRQRQGDTNTSAGAPVWLGVPGGPFKPLAMTEVAAVEEAVLHLLETLGLSQAIPSMVERVVARGVTVPRISACYSRAIWFLRPLPKRGVISFCMVRTLPTISICLVYMSTCHQVAVRRESLIWTTGMTAMVR